MNCGVFWDFDCLSAVTGRHWFIAMPGCERVARQLDLGVITQEEVFEKNGYNPTLNYRTKQAAENAAKKIDRRIKTGKTKA